MLSKCRACHTMIVSRNVISVQDIHSQEKPFLSLICHIIQMETCPNNLSAHTCLTYRSKFREGVGVYSTGKGEKNNCAGEERIHVCIPNQYWCYWARRQRSWKWSSKFVGTNDINQLFMIAAMSKFIGTFIQVLYPYPTFQSHTACPSSLLQDFTWKYVLVPSRTITISIQVKTLVVSNHKKGPQTKGFDCVST